MAISRVSFSARSMRPPLVNCSTDSLRCFSKVCSTCMDSLSSSGRIFSISLFFSADLTMRRTDRRSSSFDFMASVRSFWMRSANVMGNVRNTHYSIGNAGSELRDAADAQQLIAMRAIDGEFGIVHPFDGGPGDTILLFQAREIGPAEFFPVVAVVNLLAPRRRELGPVGDDAAILAVVVHRAALGQRTKIVKILARGFLIARVEDEIGIARRVGPHPLEGLGPVVARHRRAAWPLDMRAAWVEHQELRHEHCGAEGHENERPAHGAIAQEALAEDAAAEEDGHERENVQRAHGLGGDETLESWSDADGDAGGGADQAAANQAAADVRDGAAASLFNGNAQS